MSTMQALGGNYFEDLEVGQTFTTRARTITEADIVNFAGISGDYNPIHTDEEFAKQGQFETRIAHGLLGLAVASGLTYATGMLEGTVLAWTGLDWKFRAPVYIGDTIHTEIVVSKVREAKRAGGGFVTFDLKVKNQEGAVTQKGTWTILVASKPDNDE